MNPYTPEEPSCREHRAMSNALDSWNEDETDHLSPPSSAVSLDPSHELPGVPDYPAIMPEEDPNVVLLPTRAASAMERVRETPIAILLEEALKLKTPQDDWVREGIDAAIAWLCVGAALEPGIS